MNILLADDLDNFLEFESKGFHKEILVFLAGFDDDLVAGVEEIDFLVLSCGYELLHEEIHNVSCLSFILAAVLLHL